MVAQVRALIEGGGRPLRARGAPCSSRDAASSLVLQPAGKKWFIRLITVLFVLWGLSTLIEIVGMIMRLEPHLARQTTVKIGGPVTSKTGHFGFVEWANLAASIVSGLFVLWGLARLRRSRAAAYAMFERALLISISSRRCSPSSSPSSERSWGCSSTCCFSIPCATCSPASGSSRKLPPKGLWGHRSLPPARLPEMRAPALLSAAFVIGLLAGALSAQPERASSLGSLRAAMSEMVAEGVPGVAVLIVRAHQREFLTAGYGDRERRAPIRRTDRFRIASVSKAFNAAVVVGLARARKLKLSDTVERWLPGLLKHGRRIKIRQLLRHTSGLPDYTKDPDFLRRLGRNPQRSRRPRELVSFVASKPLHFRPGSRYEYSDTENIVLGLIAVARTKHSYETQLRTRVFRPLGLRSTSLPRGLRIPGAHVHGYQYEHPAGGGALEDVTSALNPTVAWASGGMVSTLPNLSRFFSALLRGRMVGHAYLRRMKRTVPGSSSPAGPGMNRAGLGIFRYRMPCGIVWGHTGSFPGYRLFAAASADGRQSVAFISNATHASVRADRLALRVQRLAVCRALGR